MDMAFVLRDGRPSTGAGGPPERRLPRGDEIWPSGWSGRAAGGARPRRSPTVSACTPTGARSPRGTAAAAAGLRDRFGLRPGHRVAIVMGNRPEYLEALYAIWHAGLVAVPVNARLHRDEIAYVLEHSGSRRGRHRRRRTPTT